MSPTFPPGTARTVHRIDLACEQTDFVTPPCDVHIKFLPGPVAGQGWTLLAHAAAGKPDILARWLRTHPGFDQIQVAPGIAPKLLRATTRTLPPAWTAVAALASVHHLDLAPDGHASWFVEAPRAQVVALVQHLGANAAAPVPGQQVRCRAVLVDAGKAPITRRQHEALSAAVALGYYEIPHRIDLRALARRTGVSLGSVAELLRRAEAAILTYYVDTTLMQWPSAADEPVDVSLGIPNAVRPGALHPHVRPHSGPMAHEDGVAASSVPADRPMGSASANPMGW